MQWYRKRALARFIVFPLILLLIFSPLYISTVAYLKKNAGLYNEKLLEQGLTELEHEIRQLTCMGEILYADDAVFPLTHLRVDGETPGTIDAYRIKKAQDVFSTVSTIDLKQTKCCGILFPGSIMLHGGKVCFSEKEYYGSFLLAEGCQTYSQWKSTISKPGRLYNLQLMRICIDSVWGDHLVFSMSLPSNGMWNSVFYAAIPLGTVLNTLDPFNTNGRKTLRLYDNYGLLYENEQLTGNTVRISASGSENILHAELYIPGSIYARSIIRYGRFAIAACAVFAVLGVGLSWLFSIRSTKNLEHAITAIDAAVDTWDMKGTAYTEGDDFISGFLEQVDERLKSDHLSLAQQENLIRTNLMDSVLLHAASGTVTMDVLRQYYPDFPLRYRLCVILCPGIDMADQTTFSRFRLRLEHLVIDLLPETSITHFADAQLTVIQPYETDEMIQSRYATISKTILQELGQESAIVIDETCTGIDDISRCFARVQFHIYAGTGNVVLLHTRQTMEDGMYPLCNETAFHQAIIKGEKDKARAMLDKSVEELAQGRMPDPGEIRQVYYSYRAVLLQVISSSVPGSVPAAYDEKKTVEDNFLELKNCIDEIDRRLQEEQRKNADRFEQMIVDWIDEHLYDVNLSISMVMDELSASSRVLQSAVHRLTGMSFREYVIDRRIDKARHLLKETRLSVAEISEQCGYASVNAFYKSFKKANMVSPNEMRSDNTAPPDLN